MELVKPLEAARELSVSYQTLKQWIYQGKVRSVKTPGGHHRIARSEIDRLSAAGQTRNVKNRGGNGHSLVSGRNRLRGLVVEVVSEGLLAQIQIDVGGQKVTSIITKSACEELGLKKGVTAVALIKATEVMVIRE